jgi:hypothetical protein
MMEEPLVVPDFDNYPIHHSLTGATKIDNGVLVRWDDGLESRLPGIWLREFSPDSNTFNVLTREQKVALTDLPATRCMTHHLSEQTNQRKP